MASSLAAARGCIRVLIEAMTARARPTAPARRCAAGAPECMVAR